MQESKQAGQSARVANLQPGKLALSVSIVCKDNRDTIERVLQSVTGLAEEIVAVDSGSTGRSGTGVSRLAMHGSPNGGAAGAQANG